MEDEVGDCKRRARIESETENGITNLGETNMYIIVGLRVYYWSKVIPKNSLFV